MIHSDRLEKWSLLCFAVTACQCGMMSLMPLWCELQHVTFSFCRHYDEVSNVERAMCPGNVPTNQDPMCDP